MLETPRFSTVKMKRYIKARIPLLTLFHIFIDLGLQFHLCENESYSTFVAKAGFFYAQKSL